MYKLCIKRFIPYNWLISRQLEKATHGKIDFARRRQPKTSQFHQK